MLEKIGLPQKPSLRGNNWVVDATHCQGCSSQFTFINRKHHCRRCGGIFCNSCTQQRMVLRGQGDSPVRICEPCKNLEEAARFEMRYGHKNRAGRGGSKLTNKRDDEVGNQILGSEGTAVLSSRSASTRDMLSGAQKASYRASSSSFQEVSSHDEKEDRIRSLSRDPGLDVLTEVGSFTPEELRQQALEEKKKFKTLKADRKPEEALRAFKRGKELERQAGALEMQLRKNRKKDSLSSHASEFSSIKEDSKASVKDGKLPTVKSKAKDDHAAELRELGWSDMDLRDSDKKAAPISLEGELSTLIGEASQRTSAGKGNIGIDKSQVIVHKKKALELKRGGKLAEAKEELKRAKLLEKQIEEQELLGDDEDSDEEFSLLTRSLNDNKHDSSVEHDIHHGFDFDPLMGLTEDIAADSNLEVTEEDMDDPEIAAALKSLGWTEEASHSEDLESQFPTPDTEDLSNMIQSLKKDALSHKRAGNTEEALTLLKKAKLLEKGLHGSDSQEPANFGNMEPSNVNKRNDLTPNTASKSKLMIQKELLGLKKKALALRREGKLDEAEEELKKGKVLEKQLEEMDNTPKVSFSINKQVNRTMISDVGDEEEVTDQDMNDPTYLSFLKSMGWEDDDNKNMPFPSSKESEGSAALIDGSTATQATSNIQARPPRKSKHEIQRELLGLKRKALALRRQGEVEEADEVIKGAEVLEAQLAEIEKPMLTEVQAESEEHNDSIKSSLGTVHLSYEENTKQSPIEDFSDKVLTTVERPEKIVAANEKPNSDALNSSLVNVSENDGNSLQQDILAHKRKAVSLKREGKLAEAKEELRQAKLLEKHTEEMNSQPSTSSTDFSSSDVPPIQEKESSPDSGPKKLSSRDRFKLQQESLYHKRQALKLRREGRTEDADAEFQLAKALEAQLEESTMQDSANSSENAVQPLGDVAVEDFLDPELLSALKSIGLQNASSVSQVEIHGSKEQVATKSDKSREERMQLEEQIKAEKLKALNLKRSGKQAEALEALRRSKLYEKKLNSLIAQ